MLSQTLSLCCQILRLVSNLYLFCLKKIKLPEKIIVISGLLTLTLKEMLWRKP